MTIVISILLLTVCVAVHEFGHAAMGMRRGFAVKSFGLGFRPGVTLSRTHGPRT